MRIAGHPVHPMLVHFPIASWTAAVAADLSSRVWALPELTKAAFVCVAAGLVTGALAIMFGFLDYAGIETGHPAQRTATRHMLVMGVAWLVFLARLAAGWQAVSPWLTVADVVGFLVMLCGAQLGGSLVYRYRVGVSAH